MIDLLNTEQAAAVLGVSKSTLEHWRILRKGPPFRRLGQRLVRYCPRALAEWAERQTVETR